MQNNLFIINYLFPKDLKLMDASDTTRFLYDGAIIFKIKSPTSSCGFSSKMNICQQSFSVIDILCQITPNYFRKCQLTKYAKYDKLFSGNDVCVVCYNQGYNQKQHVYN